MDTTSTAADVKIETWPPTQGGQHVGVLYGIKVTHLESGLEAFCDTDRSQHRNRAIAFDRLLGGLTSPHYRGPR